MLAANKVSGGLRGWLGALALGFTTLAVAAPDAASNAAPSALASPTNSRTTSRTAHLTPSCQRPVYLTFDTGHMGVAPLVAEVLAREQVPVTFFLANERTLTEGGSLDEQWAPWWRARVAEGHLFASHTFDHVYWRADLPGGRFSMRPTAGPQAGQTLTWTAADYCQELRRSAERFHAMTGATMAPLFRAPGGKTSPALLAAAAQCGFAHVGWAPAGFLGDELPSQTYPNQRLLDRALRDIRAGDILMAHLGIWSRQDPWAPAVLAPLIQGLKQRGLCFATLREHPAYRAQLAGSAGVADALYPTAAK